MAFLVVSAANVAKAEEGGGYITESGIYELTLKHAEVKGTKNGATQINYIFDKTMSYGNTVVGKDGNPTFGMGILEGLAATLSEESLSDPEPTPVKFKTETKDLMCIPELENVSVKAWVAFSYSRYNDDISEKVAIKRFYRVGDGASGTEVLTGENIGTQIAKDEKYASETKYEDGITAEEVADWKKANAGKNSKSKGNAAKDAGFTAKPKVAFPGQAA